MADLPQDKLVSSDGQFGNHAGPEVRLGEVATYHLTYQVS